MERVQVLPDFNQVAETAGDLFMRAAEKAIERQGCFSVSLAGGSTPSHMYRLLASQPYRSRLSWHNIHFFWGDERCVPPDDPNSNYRLAYDLLLAHLPVPPANLHRMHGELPCDQGALQYENELRSFFTAKAPNFFDLSFDLILLGIGEDGHTASLFPGSQALSVKDRWVVGVEHHTPPDPEVNRISLTLPVINASRLILFLVSGASKSHILAQILKPLPDQLPLPASLVHPVNGDLIWLIDAPAAGELSNIQPHA